MAGDEEPPNPHQGCVNRVAVRAPPFWPEKPALWFAQLEAQFALAGITLDSTKFHHVLAQLDSKYAAEVEDLIINPPTENQYDSVKRELISRLTASQSSRMRQLLEREEIGDRTPSQFLRHLRGLGAPTLPEEMLRTLWMGRLPLRMQDILTASPTTDLAALAKLADKIADIPSGPRVAAVGADDRFDELTRQLASLTASVAALSAGHTHSSRQRSRSNSRPRRSSPHSSSPVSEVCWYHRTFGDQARRCLAPCTYTGKAKGGQ